MAFYWLILGALATWRITHLLHAEDGPGDVFVRLRLWAGEGVIGKAMDCFLCLSMWVAAPFAVLIGQSWMERGLLWLALSAVAILIERTTTRAQTTAQSSYFEDQPFEREALGISHTPNTPKQENADVQLWQQAATNDRANPNSNSSAGDALVFTQANRAGGDITLDPTGTFRSAL